MASSNSTDHSLFISDIHLCEQRPDISQAFVDFCAHQATQASHLYILGDLCDAWLGDDDNCAIAELLQQQLLMLAEKNVKVSIMVGNRDFLMGHEFSKACNCKLLPDPSVIELYDQSALLMHGDSMCTADKEYMDFREMIRDPKMQQTLLNKPLSERRAIATMLREKSRSANATKAEDIMDVTASEVTRAFEQHGVDILIHGHTHRPAVHQLPSTDEKKLKRYVLGDWDSKGWYLKAQQGQIALHSFEF
ncbi:MAG: UDP-2,3-diacylglucosamine diphosphatase [Cellvibrionales bacterium]|nr:UDP-2,3-diacylglucosamine diphosphatase [Cellvibrionales bacterium]